MTMRTRECMQHVRALGQFLASDRRLNDVDALLVMSVACGKIAGVIQHQQGLGEEAADEALELFLDGIRKSARVYRNGDEILSGGSA